MTNSKYPGQWGQARTGKSAWTGGSLPRRAETEWEEEHNPSGEDVGRDDALSASSFLQILKEAVNESVALASED